MGPIRFLRFDCRLALIVFISLTPLLLKAKEIYTVESPFFIVAGEDYKSTKYVAGLGALLAEWGSSHLPQPEQFTEPIVVRLPSTESSAFGDPSFSVFLEKTGRVSVTLIWNEALAVESVCEALSQAFLKKLAMGYYGHRSAEEVPYWIELALACELSLRIYPAMRDYWVGQVHSLPLLSAETILTARSDFPNKAVLQFNAYWFLRALDMELSEKDLKGLLKSFLARGDPLIAISYAFEDIFEDTEAFEFWWTRQFKVTLQKNQPPVLSLESSREQIFNWAVLVLETEKDSIESWERRERITRDLDGLVQEIKLKLVRINPLYFNAALSLGQFLESLDQEPIASERILEQFKRDFKQAQFVEQKIQALSPNLNSD